MQDTGQHMDAGQLLRELMQRDSQLYQLQAQLRHFQTWTACLASTALQPLNMPVMLAAIQVMVAGFPDGTTERDLALFFNDLIAANRAAVAPGPAVSDCKLLRGSRGVALLELRCAIEASNCMAFDGVQFKGSRISIQRPRDYRPDAAILLGPVQPDPAVLAALSHTTQHQQHMPPAAAGHPDHSSSYQNSYPVASTAAAAAPWASAFGSSSSYPPGPAAGPVKHPAATAAADAAHSHAGRMFGSHAVAAAPAGPVPAADAGLAPNMGMNGGNGAAAQDLAPAGDQGKQDEVFIGGLPSHWKAQQVKDLLAPYGQLKSLSVAMDAATGKNKGYAFVVFADTTVVPQAIEELDCKVVEGKILAVQRATEGKAACAGSLGKDIISSHHHMTLGGSSGSGSRGPIPSSLAGPQQQQKQLQQLQPRHHHQRGSSCSSSGSSSTGGFTPVAAAAAAAGAAAGAAAAALARNGGLAAGQQVSNLLDGMQPFGMQQRQQQQPGNPAAAGPQATQLQQQMPNAMRSAGPTAGVAAGDGVALGQRLLAAVTAGAAASAVAGGMGPQGPASGCKQYDVNELYIGDLPLGWDEDAVRRLLGRYGKIKYFTLRNGRDKNFAFCKFKDSSVVDAAIQGLHGKIVDGYFLNVRRAIEGKQQHQQSREWQGKRVGPAGPPAAAAAAVPAAAAVDRAPLVTRFGQLQMGPQQQQQQQAMGAKATVPGLYNGAQPPAAAAAAATGKLTADGVTQQQQQQQCAVQNAHADASKNACVPAAAGAAADQEQQQRDSTSTASTAPSPPRTPTAASLQQQQQQEDVAPAAAQQKVTSPDTILQQQQQAASLFLNSSGPASWGAPGLFTAAYQQQQQQQAAPQQSSLLQTWDMLSPWSLFSGTASKVQW